MDPNIELVRRFFEKQANRDDTSLYDEFIAKQVVLHGPASGQKIKGRQALLKIDAAYNRAYAGKKFHIDEIFSQDERVFVRWTCKGRKKSDFCVFGLSIYRIAKRKIAEIWQYWDRLGLLEQIGEIRIRKDPADPGYSETLLKDLGMEEYVEKASLLSERERHCLRGLLEGKTAKETASLYKISHRTVETYFEKLKRKLHCPTKRELFTVAQALEKLELL